jgi:predicted nucleic-acid-binding protein
MPRPRNARARRSVPVHLVDTNVILRYLIGDDPPSAAKATALMKRVERAEEEIFLPDDIVAETVWTLQSYCKVPRQEIADRLIALLSFAGVRVSARNTLRESLHLYATTGADFPDCLLAARSRHRAMPVYTFDETDFKKLGCAWEEP